MTPIKPVPHHGGHLISHPMVASVDADGLVMTEWELSLEERERLLCGGAIRLWMYTNGFPIQPLVLEALVPTKIVVKES